MKKLFVLPVIISLAIFCSCQKQQTEEERNAEIERQVQQRLAAERQAQSEQQLAQRETELDARERALAEKQRAAENASVVEASETPPRSSRTGTSGDQPTASYSTFYRKLEPHGVWRETSIYGYVWQPREAERSRSWRPYTNGRWVYTDAGWTWLSEEPFGWATYHYGRWTRLRNIGWVWVPGDEWAPAWVSWRKSDDYVGWAPLPPEARFDRRTGIHNWADNYYDIGPDQYCFIPTNQFGARRVETAVIPVERNVTMVNQTTNVTNITYSNTTIVNQGPSYDELRARSQQPVERLRLERQITANLEAESPHPVVRGEVIQMPAPVIGRGHPTERPRRVKETVAQTVVEHGWEGIADRQAAEKARAKIKSESTPPPDAPPKTFVKPAQTTSDTSSPTFRPALAAPAASPVQAPLASPTGRPKQTAPAVSPKIPTSTATASPRTPSRRATPVATASPVSEFVPSPTVTATPFRRATPIATATAAPASTPSAAPAAKAFEAPTAPSEKATNSESTPPSRLSGRSAEDKDQRKAERELRKQGQAPQGHQSKDELQKAKSTAPEASPGESPVRTPKISPAPAESPKKAEKKKRKRERAGVDESAAGTSPSPSPPE